MPSFYLEYHLQHFLVNDIGPIQETSPRKEIFRELVFLRSCIK